MKTDGPRPRAKLQCIKCTCSRIRMADSTSACPKMWTRTFAIITTESPNGREQRALGYSDGRAKPCPSLTPGRWRIIKKSEKVDKDSTGELESNVRQAHIPALRDPRFFPKPTDDIRRAKPDQNFRTQRPRRNPIAAEDGCTQTRSVSES